MRGLALLALPWLALSPAAAKAQDHAHHHHEPTPAETPTEAPPPPPAPPGDHAADAYFDPAAMAAARKALVREAGGLPTTLVRLDRLERRVARGGDGYHWEGEAYTGGDLDRVFVKSQGEGDWGGSLESAEVQLLYSRAIGPYFNLQAGFRHDIRPAPQRTHAVLAIEGIAPYWLEVEGELFLSNKGEARLRLEASYDQRITQRLILQPQVELNFAAQDVPEIGLGAGLSNAEAGLRLRYEIVREFAPYVGLSWERKFGETGRLARAAGDRRQATTLALGIRAWF